MEEKKHVGRPTNEEVASRKRKKVVKVSLITLVCVLLFGGLFLFLYRDNIDFSSIMGASTSKRMLFVVNGYSKGVGYYDSIILDTSNLNASGYTSCKVSNKKKASCEIIYKNYNKSELRVYAKKKGNVNIKVYGKKDNGKSVKKTIKLKIKDYSPPRCYLEKAIYNAKRGSDSVFFVECNEKIDYNGYTRAPDGWRSFTSVSLKYDAVISYSCKYSFNYSDLFEAYVSDAERITDNRYMLSIRFPKSVCSGTATIMLKKGLFKDSNGNRNFYPIYSDRFNIY